MSRKSMREFSRKMQEIREAQDKRKYDNDIFKVFVILGAFSLHNKFGFDDKELESWMDDVNYWLDDINEGDGTLEEKIEILNEETGFIVQGRHKVKNVEAAIKEM